MSILSFILIIETLSVIVAIIVASISFYKVKKQDKKIDSLRESMLIRMDELIKKTKQQFESTIKDNQNITNYINGDINKRIYSRLDKIENRLKDEKDRTKNLQTNRFEKWEDAVSYMGKQITVSFVERPDVTGLLTGISLVMNGDKIVTAFLEVQNNKYEYWKCKA